MTAPDRIAWLEQVEAEVAEMRAYIDRMFDDLETLVARRVAAVSAGRRR